MNPSIKLPQYSDMRSSSTPPPLPGDVYTGWIRTLTDREIEHCPNDYFRCISRWDTTPQHLPPMGSESTCLFQTIFD